MNSLFANVSQFDRLDILPEPSAGRPDFGGFMHGLSISLDRLSKITGYEIALNKAVLKTAYDQWLSRLAGARAMMAPRPMRDSLNIASALVEILLTAHDAFTFRRPAGAPAADPMAELMDFWPEGITSFHYGLGLYGRLISPEIVEPPRKIEELSLWWSVKENLGEDIGMVAPFLELFAGQNPNWGRFYKAH